MASRTFGDTDDGSFDALDLEKLYNGAIERYQLEAGSGGT